MSIWLSTNVYCWLLGFMQMIQLEDEKHTEEKGQWLFNIFFDRYPHLSQMVLEGQRRRARQPLLDWCKSYDTKRWETYQRRLSARNGNVHLYIRLHDLLPVQFRFCRKVWNSEGSKQDTTIRLWRAHTTEATSRFGHNFMQAKPARNNCNTNNTIDSTTSGAPFQKL